MEFPIMMHILGIQIVVGFWNPVVALNSLLEKILKIDHSNGSKPVIALEM
jgi:hypothetical protein